MKAVAAIGCALLTMMSAAPSDASTLRGPASPERPAYASPVRGRVAPSGRAAAPPPAAPAPSAASPQPAPPPTADQPAAPASSGPPPETVEADVSTHTVSVTSAFSGTEVVVFGTVANSRQGSAESGYYDIVVLIEGRGAPAVVRLKDNVGGLWINTQAVRFNNLPLYSALASTRPVEEIAEPRILVASGIGFGRSRMQPGKGSSRLTDEQLEAYKAAVLRLKRREGLYVRQDFGVAFIGQSLFRASVKLPANIPVGPLEARVYLFRDGQLLATNTASMTLERAGLERLIYDFAYDHPVWYGLIAVVLSATAGLAASALVRRSNR